MTDWQPIETAPVGQYVLGYYPDDPWAPVWTVIQEFGEWYGDHHTSKSGTYRKAPTHWMPHPEPPS